MERNHFRCSSTSLHLGRPHHCGPQGLRSHALYNTVLVKADDECIGGKIVVDVGVNLNPIVIVLRPRVSRKRFPVWIDKAVEVVFVVREAICLCTQFRREKSEVVIRFQVLLGQEIRAVARPLLDLDSCPSVDDQCDGRVSIAGFEGTGESSLGLFLGRGFCGFVLSHTVSQASRSFTNKDREITHKNINERTSNRRHLAVGIVTRGQDGEPKIIVWDKTEHCRVHANVSGFSVCVYNAASINDCVGGYRISVDFPRSLTMIVSIRNPQGAVAYKLQRQKVVLLTPTADSHCDVNVVGFIHLRVTKPGSSLLLKMA